MKNKYSFRSKITVILVFAIISISFVSFYIYDKFLTERIYKTTEKTIISVLHILKHQYYSVEHDAESPIKLLQNIESHNWVLNTYLADSTGNTVYISDTLSFRINAEPLKKLDLLSKEVTIEEFKDKELPFTRVYLKMQNSQKCHECHSKTTKTLGYTIYDFSMLEAEKNKSFTLKFSFFYTILLVFIIGLLITIMHYKFVRKSLAHFQGKIKKINNGDLSERIIIPESKELGQLGEDFNKMLDSFQETQQQLKSCHIKELRNNKKLATVGEMAARLAHEIRNPITGIANAIEILAGELHKEENKLIIEEIKRQANRVNDAVSSLLIYSRSKNLNVKEQDINELIKSLVLFLKSQDHHKIIDFRLNLQTNIPVFYFDEERIENALLNLGLNAIQAIVEKGTVTFITKFDASKKEVTISVKDNGIGIPIDILPKIFRAFYTTRTEGTGLGLAIVKDIVEKHHGELWVEQNTKKGSTFNISLPIEEKHVFV